MFIYMLLVNNMMRSV